MVFGYNIHQISGVAFLIRIRLCFFLFLNTELISKLLFRNGHIKKTHIETRHIARRHVGTTHIERTHIDRTHAETSY